MYWLNEVEVFFSSFLKLYNNYILFIYLFQNEQKEEYVTAIEQPVTTVLSTTAESCIVNDIVKLSSIALGVEGDVKMERRVLNETPLFICLFFFNNIF